MNDETKGTDSCEAVEVRFTGCSHLDFSDDYHARKQIIGIDGGKVFWFRDVPSDCPAMVQFCKKRGRLNSPQSCLCKEKSACSDYDEIEHVVNVPNP